VIEKVGYHNIATKDLSKVQTLAILIRQTDLYAASWGRPHSMCDVTLHTCAVFIDCIM
jgi:hypothetical protein